MTQWRENTHGEKWLASVNGNAFCNQASSVLFKQLIGDLFEKSNHLYVIVGSDSGLLADFVARYCCGQHRMFVFIEPAAILAQLRAENRLTDKPCVRFYTREDFSFDKLDDDFPAYITHNRFSINRSLAVLDQIDPQYVQIWDDTVTQYKLFRYHQSSLLGNRNFINKQLLNVALNEIPAGTLQGILADKPVLLLGGGPTLDEGISWVKQHQDEILIAAVGRIAKRLRHEGIKVDFYASVDPNDVSYDNSKWLLLEKESLLFHTPYTHSALLGEFPGEKVFTDQRYPWNTDHNPPNILTAGPTVTNTLLAILVTLGAKQIYLLGVDMCYGASGETHESGSLEAKHGKLGHSTDLQVETYSGRLAITNSIFYEGIQALDQYAQTVHTHSQARIYQLGKESAKVEHIPLVGFNEISLLSRSDKASLQKAIKEKIHFQPARRKAFLIQQRTELQEKRRCFREIASMAEDARRTAENLFKNYDQLDRQTQKITKIQHKLKSEKYNWAQIFLYSYAVGNYAKFLSPEHEDNPEDEQAIRANLINYFSALEKTAEDLLEVLDSSLERIEISLKELERKHFKTVANYWLKEQMEGRLSIWLHWHQCTLSALSQEERTLAETLQQAFEHKLHNEQETKLAQKLKKETEQLTTQFEAVQNAFETRNKAALQSIIDALSEATDTRTSSLRALAQGYLAELNHASPEQALAHYLAIKDHQFTLAGLNRVVQIGLQTDNLDLAMEALGMLAQYNDRYLVMYADLLAARGDIGGAIQLYDHYLNQHMDDYGVWLKAAKTALAGKDWAAAEQCLNEVITHSNEPSLIKEAKTLQAWMQTEKSQS